MKVGEIFNVKIIDLGMNGEGVAKVLGVPVFIPFAVTGDEAKIEIVHTKKDYAFGKIIEIIKYSPLRITPKCSVFGKCGGCDLQHINYDTQLEFKRQQLSNCLIKSIGNSAIDDVVHGQMFAYRNKLQIPLGERNGKVVVGFYKKSTHQIVSINECLLHDEWATRLINIVLNWANGVFGNQKLSAYNEKTKKGLLRHIVARYVDDFLSVTLVINGDDIPNVEKLIDKLKVSFNFSLYININKANTNVIFGKLTKLIYGQNELLSIFGINLPLSPQSFLQVNSEISKKIYEKVIAQLKGFDIIIDIYSGVGILSALLAKNMESKYRPCVYGIEIVPEATENANNVIKLNGLDNKIKNICGDASIEVPKLANEILNNSKLEAKTPSMAIIIDPPRKGCSEEVLGAIASSKAKKVVYISCNPATLARDLKILLNNYKIDFITPFEMFPQTRHVECVVLMSRVKE